VTYEFTHHRRLLDLGGGTGSFLLAVLRQRGEWGTPEFFDHLKRPSKIVNNVFEQHGLLRFYEVL